MTEVQDAQGTSNPEGLPIVQAATMVRDAHSLESLSRPFLELLHQLTGLDSTYLTSVDFDAETQQILFSDNRGAVDIPEGLRVPWPDSVCRLALARGPQYTDDVPNVFPDSDAGRELGLQTYVSVPVKDHADEVVGTLCGASGHKVSLTQEVLSVMDLFARLIGDQWERDQLRAELEVRARRAEKQLRERAIFLGEAEHKLKSPLTVIKGWSAFLDESWAELPDQQKHDAVGMISNSSDQLASQLHDLLQEARNTALSTQLNVRRVDIVPELQRVGVELGKASDAHEIRVEAPEHLYAAADTQALWQVLVHLVENAIKYSPGGGVIKVTTRIAPARVAVLVSDEGLGVPDDVDIFEPFVRSDREDLHRIEGTGVGLHIVSTLTRAMGGSVSAVRNDGPGSTFTVELATRPRAEQQ